MPWRGIKSGMMDTKMMTLSIILAVIIPYQSYGENIPSEALELHANIPSMLAAKSVYKVHAGERVVLQCAVHNLGNHRIVWRKVLNKHPITVGKETFMEEDEDRIHVQHRPEKDQWNLVFRKVRLEDDGAYECQVSSRIRHLRHHAFLTVLEPLEQTTDTHTNDGIDVVGPQYVELNRALKLRCNATGKGNPPQDLDWFKDGNKLAIGNNEKDRIVIRKAVNMTTKTIISELVIRTAKHSDTGNYVCRTSNMQIKNLMVTILNAETINVKRGTVAGDGSNTKHKSKYHFSSHNTPDHHNSGTHYNSRHGGSNNSASHSKGSYSIIQGFTSLLLIFISRYQMFPS